MWTCRYCGNSVADDSDRYCGRCGKAMNDTGEVAYDLYLMDTDPARKISVIKAVRELTSLGLKEAKDLVEDPPQPLGLALSREEADTLAIKLHTAGGVVEVSPTGALPRRTSMPRPQSTRPQPVSGCSSILYASISIMVLALIWLVH